MFRLGISGHRGFDAATARLVRRALDTVVGTIPADRLTGVSCVADGTDALFGKAVLDHGGRLEVVIPADGYRDQLPADYGGTFDELCANASELYRLPFAESSSEAFMAASEKMLSLVDRLIAVWDGLPARGYGGTADVVARARELAIPVEVIWPRGAKRD